MMSGDPNRPILRVNLPYYLITRIFSAGYDLYVIIFSCDTRYNKDQR